MSWWRSLAVALVLVGTLAGSARAAPEPSGLGQALSAAFQEFLADGGYPELYRRYVGIAPRYLPAPVTPAWPARSDGSGLDTALKRKVLRLGWCENPPFQIRDAQGVRSGFDYDLAADLAGRIGRHYGVPDLQVEWVESAVVSPLPGQEQVAMYDALIASLKRDEVAAAMSGLLIIPERPVASTSPTALLFTDVFYTGRDGLDLDRFRGGDRAALVQHLAARPADFTFMSTENGGPSAESADALAEAVRHAGGRARSLHGTIAEIVTALREGTVHFVVGDSLSLGYWSNVPDFRGLNLDIAAGDSVLELAAFTLPGGYAESELSQVLTAAFREYASQPGRYADLYEKYLGVRRDAPDDGVPGRWIPAAEATPGSTLDRVLRSGRLRFGYWRHAPYQFTRDGKDVGFEFELGNALGEILRTRYPGLQVEWVERDFQAGGDGQENIVLFDFLEPMLLRGEFDAAFTGLIRRPDRPVGVAGATMSFFWTAVYTGKDSWDLKSLQGQDRADFVQFLVEHPGTLLMSTSGGPSEETVKALVADVQAAGGSVTGVTGTSGDLIQAASRGTAHFLVGDAIALSNLAMEPGFPGLNLNIVLRADELLAPMTALDP